MKIYDIHIITYTHKHIKYINWNNNRNRLKEIHVPSDEEVMEFMEQIDENGDMKLSKAEFVLFMLHNDDVVDETDSKVGQWRNHALEKVPW